MKITPAQAKAARQLLGLSQADIAGRLGVSKSAISVFERSIAWPILNLDQLRADFEGEGIEFVTGEPGVRKRPPGAIRAKWSPALRKDDP
jgi:transcriptional regulator with XRE-family HTH domain